MSNYRWRILIYVFSFTVALALAMVCTSCATRCDEACDTEALLAACEACVNGPAREKDCVELYCAD